MALIALRVPPDIIDAIDARAAATGVGRSELIRRILTAATEAKVRETTP
jgi:predicted DNA binding CopG/RHH family protein